MMAIKAYVAPHRLADVIEALRASGLTEVTGASGCRNLAVSSVRRVHSSRDPARQHYSIDVGEPVVTEAMLDLICSDALVDKVFELIAHAAHSGEAHSGWIFAAPLAAWRELD